MRMLWWVDSLLFALLALLLIAIYKLLQRSLPNGQSQFGEAEGLRYPSVRENLLPAQTIRHAGFNPQQLFSLYWIAKIIIMFLLPLVAFEVRNGDVQNWQLLLIAGLGFVLLDMSFWALAKKRKYKIQQSISYFSDFLVVFLKSGLTLAQAFERTSEHGLPDSNPLRGELQLISTEIELGRSWNDAFIKLAERTGVKDLKRMSVILNMGHQTGVPIVTSLATHSNILREQKKEYVNELLGRKSFEALIPTLLLSLPMFIVLVFFPTGVQIYQAFQLFSSSW